jgi:xanthine dehydrogenase accessory factor
LDAQLLTAIETELAAGRTAMLATIVERAGSAPRGVGTAMVVAESGTQTGTVGGGSMEHLARQDALVLLSENTCAIRSYDIHADVSGSAAGSVTILFRPFSGEAGEKLTKLIRISLESAQEAYLVCELANNCARESSLLSSEQLCSVCGLSCPPKEAMLTEGEPRWLIEPVLPAPRVILFGGGHVAQCMARQLALLEYRIWVVEDREVFAKQELFPMSECVILSDYAQVEPLIKITKRDHGIVMSRGHVTDEQILSWLLRSEADYIGCIGSRQKIAQIREHLLTKGISQAQIDRLHAPIGLDIGAETPAEIAVSVAAELIRYCSTR